MTPPDRRLHAYRADLAAESLRDVVESPRYAPPLRRRVLAGSTPLLRAPDASLGNETELIAGELVDLYDEAEGFAWVQAKRDGYVGYVAAADLGEPDPAPTHRVIAMRSFLYPGPGMKTARLGFMPYGAEIAVLGQTGDFCETPQGFLYAPHLAALPHQAIDPVAEAERFLGVPYLWGGRTSLGIDCSGLVQTVCFACGIAAPRDSDMQEASLGTPLALPNDPATLARGTLLFWPGHVAISQGDGRMIHANAYHMMVASEPIAPALARIEAKGSVLRTTRLLPGFG